MRGIPGQDDSAFAEGGGDALVHDVGIVNDDLVWLRARMKSLKLALADFQHSILVQRLVEA